MTKPHTMITVGDFSCRVDDPIDTVRCLFHTAGDLTISFTTMQGSEVLFKPSIIPIVELKEIGGTKGLNWDGVEE
jgi:hypothetical protein